MESPIPDSTDRKTTVGPIGQPGEELVIELTPVPVMVEPAMQLDIDMAAPTAVSVQHIREAVLDEIRNGILVTEEDRDYAADLVTRHYEVAFETDPAKREKVITPKEERAAAKLVGDIFLSDASIAAMQARLKHRLTWQGIFATAYTVTKVTSQSGKDWPIARQNGRLSDSCLGSLSAALGEVGSQILTMKAFALCFLTERTAKNSDGPSKSTSNRKPSTTTKRGSKGKAASSATAKPTT